MSKVAKELDNLQTALERIRELQFQMSWGINMLRVANSEGELKKMLAREIVVEDLAEMPGKRAKKASGECIETMDEVIDQISNMREQLDA